MSEEIPSSPPEDPIRGVAHAFCETGTEGVIWSLQDEKHISPDGKQWSYDGLNCLEDGDFLRVFNDAARKDVLWEGEIKLKYPGTLEYNRGVQDGVDERSWAKMFFDEKPAILIKKEAYIKVKADAAAKAVQQKEASDLARACHEGVEVDPLKPLRIIKPRQ
ncbi:MAG: hypothetical protein EPN97_17850 [Alphaproteobacteria bacterium]|nr:MAG: hypothetical protein EPN97_17850 [Alphaproteobacteria bacterium]